jgi:acyl CoA:acetate/3-ketoacid CoA transferase beta subunit
VTPLGVFDFDGPGRTLRLTQLLPGATVAAIVERTGFAVAGIDGDVPVIDVSEVELAAVRRVDPAGARRSEFR